MGDNQSKESNQEVFDHVELYCSIDFKWLPIEKFRVLHCGHYFCKKCLESWFRQKMKHCPVCLEEENRDLENLDNPHDFKRKLLYQYPQDAEQKLDIEKMIFLQMNRRATTIR